MTTTENITSQNIHPAPLGKRMLQGAIPGLILVSAFLISAGEGKPEWGNYWMIKPFVMVPFAGAMGGLVYFCFDRMRSQGQWSSIIANLLSIIIYIVGIWMGFVLGFNGTHWN